MTQKLIVSHPSKLKELILYVAEQSKDDPTFGAVKLNKILYWADFEAYRRSGKPITGATYQHLREGPAPRELLPVREELIEEGAIVLEDRPYYGRVRQVVRTLRVPNLVDFTPEELEIVDAVVAMLGGMNARDVSDLSHQEWGWRLTDEGETIDYRSAWFSPEPLTQEQIERGKQIASTGASHGRAAGHRMPSGRVRGLSRAAS